MKQTIFIGGITLILGFVAGYFSGTKATAEAAAEMAEEARTHYKKCREALEEAKETEARNVKNRQDEEDREYSVGELVDIVDDMIASGVDPQDISDAVEGELGLTSRQVVVTERLVAPVSVVSDEVVTAMTNYHSISKQRNPEQEVKEMKKRPGPPYVISADEFMDTERENPPEQRTLTYYQGDNVLCDENTGDRIESKSVNKIVGNDNLKRFSDPEETARLSGDRNVMHVRSPWTDSEFEILNNPGRYEDEVLNRR